MAEYEAALLRLGAERDRLRVALTAGRLGAYEWHVGTEEIWWSPEAYLIYGVKTEEFTPTLQSFNELIHFEDRDRLWTETQAAINIGNTFSQEYRVVHPGGAIRWIRNQSTPSFDENGSVTKITGIAQDVTDRKSIEDRVSVLASGIDDHLVSYDAELRYTFVNDAAQRVLRKPREELLGSHVFDLYPDALGNSYHEGLLTALNEKKPVRNEVYYEPWDTWYENHIYPCVDGVTVFSTDITARKKAEFALIESEERFRSLANGLPILVWVHDASGSQEFVNDTFCEFFGVTGQIMRENRWQALIHPDDVEPYAAHFVECTQDRKPFHGIIRVADAMGRWRWVENWAQPRFTSDGTFVGMTGATIDITERLVAEHTLKEADRKKDVFLAMLAHELRGPLAPLRNSLEILKLGRINDRTIPYALDVMDRQLNQLVSLVDDLMDVNRITHGKVTLKKELLSLEQIMSEAVEATASVVEQAGQTLHTELPATPIVISADRARLIQVLSNLIHNSAKYSAPGGTITLRARLDEQHALIEVNDTGMGIPRERLDSIFEMFSQVGDHLEHEQGGLGIGLSLVRSLVELHDGRVQAFSEGLGLGTTMRIWLPCSPVELESAPAPPTSDSAKEARRILVVDDNIDSARSLAMLLQFDGHQVAMAHDGEEALAQIEAFSPEFVLLDIGLPKLNGYEVCRRIRDEGRNNLIVVALTGWGQPEDRRQSEEAGFNAHLTKPIDVHELYKLLETKQLT